VLEAAHHRAHISIQHNRKLLLRVTRTWQQTWQQRPGNSDLATATWQQRDSLYAAGIWALSLPVLASDAFCNIHERWLAGWLAGWLASLRGWMRQRG